MDCFPIILLLSEAYLFHFLENKIWSGRLRKKKEAFIMKSFLRSLSAPQKLLNLNSPQKFNVSIGGMQPQLEFSSLLLYVSF